MEKTFDTYDSSVPFRRPHTATTDPFFIPSPPSRHSKVPSACPLLAHANPTDPAISPNYPGGRGGGAAEDKSDKKNIAARGIATGCSRPAIPSLSKLEYHLMNREDTIRKTNYGTKRTQRAHQCIPTSVQPHWLLPREIPRSNPQKQITPGTSNLRVSRSATKKNNNVCLLATIRRKCSMYATCAHVRICVCLNVCTLEYRF